MIPAQGRQQQLRLLPWALLDKPGEEVFGQAKTWRSSTPYLPTRHPKSRGRDSLADQISRECELRGLPRPTIIIIKPAPGGYVTHRHGKPKAIGPAQLIELEFSAAIPGPLLLGASSHFGMGRFEPLQKESSSSAPISP